jgi:hypothetical protein
VAAQLGLLVPAATASSTSMVSLVTSIPPLDNISFKLVILLWFMDNIVRFSKFYIYSL